MNQNTAGALRAACSQVLKAMDGWETIDVTSIDVDDLLRRFSNLRAKDFTPGSLGTYEQRFRRALESYLEYVKNPSAWKPASSPSPSAKAGAARKKPDSHHAHDKSTATVPDASPRGGLVDYPFPIRDGQTARLVLPRDLRSSEVKRLTAFMNTLVDEPETPTK